MQDVSFQPTWVGLLGFLCLGLFLLTVAGVVLVMVLSSSATRTHPSEAPLESDCSELPRRRHVPPRQINASPVREGHCPECGAELPPDSPGGLCPPCLLRGGLGSSDPDGEPRTTPHPGRFAAPSPG